ncbi:hypothetical protein NE237_015821 [Protea cynaroides]|uniref:RING-type domain-containing protein n=1 Tax=Protea cynaroides TaxID=273540 RepID=A0A9Q0QRF3_9MAGN|nr:hypothetical protein NE237_015821 [Protea cynaroides]
MEAGGACRRRLTHQVSVVDRFDTSNRRDLLRVKDDDESYRDSMTGLTLGAVLGCESKRQVTIPPVSRTLLDIIRDEESGHQVLACQNRKKWKCFRDRLRLRRPSAAWESSPADGDCRLLRISDPAVAPPISGSTVSDQSGNGPDNREDIVTEYDTVAAANGPVMVRLAAALATERELQRQRVRSNPAPVVEEVREEQVVVEPAVRTQLAEEAAPARMSLMALLEEAAPARMSLMALLEETDRQSGMLGSALMGDMAEEEEEDADEDGGEYVCCVCMVRHKGAAFIPCGHAFCRLCSRELWVSRGNCPLCNGFILEILDIF